MDRDVPGAIDTVGEYLSYTVFFVVVGVLLGAAGGLYFWMQHPLLDVRIHNRLDQPPNYTSNGEIVFTREQVEDAEDALVQRLQEYGYCLEVRGNRVSKLRHPLKDFNSTKSHITTVCPEVSNGHLHTHPGFLAVPRLSMTDKVALVNSTYKVMCVIADPVPRSVSSRPVGLNCFKNPYPERYFYSRSSLLEAVKDTGFPRIQVKIQSSGENR